MDYTNFLPIAHDLEDAGLLWRPEIGDEVFQKIEPQQVSILVDPQGMTPKELRQSYLWLPTVEQLLQQFEARQAVLFHAGLELSSVDFCYKAVIKTPGGQIERTAESLRSVMAISLRDILLGDNQAVH